MKRHLAIETETFYDYPKVFYNIPNGQIKNRTSGISKNHNKCSPVSKWTVLAIVAVVATVATVAILRGTLIFGA